VFLVNVAQIWLCACALNIGAPFRAPLWTNPALVAVLVCARLPRMAPSASAAARRSRDLAWLVPTAAGLRWRAGDRMPSFSPKLLPSR
jgi:hypothetical protein